MERKQVPVEHLRVGMYVAELDRPWLGTPFLFQGFSISSQDEIDTLKSLCKIVYVDIATLPLPDAPRMRSHVQGIDKDHLRGSVVYKEVTPVEQELTVAKQIYTACEVSVRKSLESLRSEGGDLDPKPLKSAVTSMTKSIERNPDAMMLLFRIKQKSDYELTRAVDNSVLMITFARFLQFPSERLELLGLAGLLLDIGKVKLPDDILHKKEVLTPVERELAKTHVKHSVELIRAAAGLPKGVADIVVQHHERQDGSGYPRRLSGKEISIDGYIAGLVNTFSALTAQRPYAEQSAPSNALNQLYKLRGSLFPEALVEQFIQCIGIYPVGSAVELNTGEIGIVIAQNLVRRLQPRVMVILDKDWRPINPQVILDLVKEPKATPDEPYRIRRTLPKDKLPIDPADFFL